MLLTGFESAGDGEFTGDWQESVLADHPLVGRIWDTANKRYVTSDQLADRMVSSPFVMLGEKHDNADHHRIQAGLVEALGKRGRKPVVAFEMIAVDKAEALSEFLASHPRTTNGLEDALDWQKSGWPDWKIYEPIFSAALAQGMSLAATNLPRPKVRDVVKNGLSSLDPALVARTGLDQPLPDGGDAALVEEIRTSHCNQLPDEMIPRMALAQRARDAFIADRVADEAQNRDGVILITGNGHARKDRGVPLYLRRLRPRDAVSSLAILEVEPDSQNPADYVDAGSYDFLWFTPRVDLKDPCERFRGQLEKAGKAKSTDRR